MNIIISRGGVGTPPTPPSTYGPAIVLPPP